MSDLVRTMSSAAMGMAAQASRLRVSTENIANADTPGYRRKLVPFEQVLADNGVRSVRAGRVYLDRTDLSVVHDPSHPLARADGTYLGSNVDLIVEIADAREAQRSYEANMRMFDQARQMADSLITLLRR